MAESNRTDGGVRMILAFGHNGFGQIEPNGKLKLCTPTVVMKDTFFEIYATWRFTLLASVRCLLLQGSIDPCSTHQSEKVALSYAMKKLCLYQNQIIVGLTSDHSLVSSDGTSGVLTECGNKFEDIWCTHEAVLVQESNRYHKIVNLRGNNISTVPFPVIAVSQVSCGHSHTLILTADYSAYVYGNGSRGELGLGDLEERKEPVLLEALGGLTTIQVSAGGWHNLALGEGGDVYSWGWNESGQLGLETTVQVVSTPTLLPLQERDEQTEFRRVSCGSRHSCALSRDGRVYTWGWGEYGQLGHGDLVSHSGPKPLNLTAETDTHKIADVIAGHWNTYIIAEL